MFVLSGYNNVHRGQRKGAGKVMRMVKSVTGLDKNDYIILPPSEVKTSDLFHSRQTI